MKKTLIISLCIAPLLVLSVGNRCYSQEEITPLKFLKAQELTQKNVKGNVYLGKVMTLTYKAYSVDADEKYHIFILELTDVLKTPLRNNYLLLLKGYSDSSGAPEENMRLSLKRAENLKKKLLTKYYIKEKRVTIEGHGEADPVASNDTVEGRRLNRRVEIHISGDVSEAVRFIEKEEEAR